MALALFQKGKPQFWPGGLSLPTPPPIFLDATIREEHDLRFAKTTHPIESRLFVTDHVIELPRTLVMDVVVTNHPDSLVPNTNKNRAKLLQDKLEQLAKRREPFDVMTSLRGYTDMVITSVRTPRSLATTNALVITVTMEQIEFAEIDVASNMSDAAVDGAEPQDELGAVEGI